MKKRIVLFCSLLCVVLAQAQQDTSWLQAVTIESTRFTQYNTGAKHTGTDSVASIAFRTQTLADLLASQSQVFIKSYGTGIASPSFRGSSAEQTAVLWKGFNIQNPMLGQVDFSMVTGDVFDNISVQYGGNGALFGSGAVGGTISLESGPHYQSGLHGNIGYQLGSFGHHRVQSGISFGSRKWFGTVKVFRLQANNDFSYTNTFLPNQPTVTQTHAAATQKGLVTEQYWLIKSNQQLNVNIWLQETQREVPPTMSVPASQATQTDQTYRATAEWKLTQQNMVWMARTAWFDERIDYVNPMSILLSGYSHSQTNITEAEANWLVAPKHSINIGIKNTYTTAYADGYEGTFDRNRTALFVSYKTRELVKGLTSTASLRQEWVKQNDVPLMPSIGAEYRLTKWLNIFGNITRSYRLPTFNELYWKSVTTLVQPESGWSEEININTRLNYKRWNLESTLGVFNRNINNWIVWQPGAIDWVPQNIKKVWSRGVEADAKLSYAFNNWRLSYHITANCILSTNRQTALANDVSINKQLIYVPRITHQHQLLAAFKTWHIGVLQNYVGLRFITTDNLQWLDDYSLTSVVAGKQFDFGKFALVFAAQCNNIFNTSYVAVADRPMPGRNFLFNTTFKF